MKMLSKNFLIKAILVFSICFIGANNALAQDVQPLVDKIDKLERDMVILQRQIYRSGVTGEAIKAGKSEGATTVSSGGDSSSDAPSLTRVGELDEMIRNITGQIEVVTHQIDEVSKRVEAVNKDISFRLDEMQAKLLELEDSNKKQDEAIANFAQKAVDNAHNATNAATAKTATAGAKGAATKTATKKTTDKATKDTRKPEEIYDTAFNLLKASKYAEAEKDFDTLLKNYPDNKLAGNAQYWLGESYYARQDYASAAVAFANGYQKYKDSSKGADSLLKLGFAMNGLKKTTEACTAFSSVAKEFPKASKLVLDRAKLEIGKLGCK